MGAGSWWMTPHPSRSSYCNKAALKAVRCGIEAEPQILSLNGNAPRRLEQDYLRWARELREDLKSLGLRRQAKPVQDFSNLRSQNQSAWLVRSSRLRGYSIRNAGSPSSWATPFFTGPSWANWRVFLEGIIQA